MTRELILWRHADAGEPLDDARADFERPLSTRGQCQARDAAHWLRTRVSAGIELLCSPAPRARRTARCLAVPRIEPRLAPSAPLAQLIALVGELQATGTVLVGHQPGLGLLAQQLLGDTRPAADPVSIRKGAVWCFALRRGGWRLEAVHTPGR